MSLSTTQCPPIFMYHSVSDHMTPQFDRFTISVANFEQQMAHLHQHQYTPLTVTQFANAIANDEPLPSRPVILTFDDSFTDFYTNAMPILQKYEFPATLYIPTSFVGTTSRWLDDIGEGHRSILGWGQLREIADSMIECGAHSQTHADLDTVSYAQARQEIFESKAILENHLGREITSFAYPFGHLDSTVHKLVREAGFTSACTVMMPWQVDLYRLPRKNIGSKTTFSAFTNLLERRVSIPERLLAPLASDLWQIARRSKARRNTTEAAPQEWKPH